MITYTGAEHRGRVLMWYRKEEGHKNERQARGLLHARSLEKRVDGQTVEEEVLSRVSHRIDVLALPYFLHFVQGFYF